MTIHFDMAAIGVCQKNPVILPQNGKANIHVLGLGLATCTVNRPAAQNILN